MGGTEPRRNDSGAVLDAIVLLALERSLGAYCQQARRRGDAATLLIRAVIVTARSLERPERFQALAARIVREALPGARVRVHVDRQAAVAAPGYRITLQPPPREPGAEPYGPPTEPEPEATLLRTAPRPDRPAPEPGPPPGPAVAPLVLTLAYGDWRWRYLLPDADRWLPLGRGLGSGSPATVRIPDFAAVVPRGRLLLIRHHGGVTRLHRCNERRGYLVRLDGRALTPGHSLPVGATGRITYGLAAARAGARPSEVVYTLSPSEVR